MKKSVITLILTLSGFSNVATASTAPISQCLNDKYDDYISTSLEWYQDLVSITTQQNPQLKDVGEWFLEGRTHHFELNRAAVHYYLTNDPTKVAIKEPVESWLKLPQPEIKQLAQRNDELGKIAKATFDDRQAPPNKMNYELRSAFAELLSHPSNINPALDKYNQAMAKTSDIICQ